MTPGLEILGSSLSNRAPERCWSQEAPFQAKGRGRYQSWGGGVGRGGAGWGGAGQAGPRQGAAFPLQPQLTADAHETFPGKKMKAASSRFNSFSAAKLY